MDQWQKEYIVKNLCDLMENIDCNIKLLSYLRQCGVLSAADISKLKAVGKSEGDYEKNNALLGILMTRTKGYEYLAKALFQCKQTGGLLKLLDGYTNNLPGSSPFELCGIEINVDEILAKDVIFGGNKLPLKDVCQDITVEVLSGLIRSGMDATTFEQFLSEKPIELTVNTIPESIPYYIPRTLSINTEVDPGIFQKLENDIFCIEGAELHQLSNLASMKGKDKKAETPNPPDWSRNQRQAVTTRFIVLERPDHFPDIAEKAKKPVHWLQFSEGKYWYVKSSPGSQVKTVSNFLVSKGLRNVSEEEFVERYATLPGNEPVFIYDSPGMGKSVLLAEIARKTKERKPEDSVIHFEISELIRKVRQVDENCSCAAVQKTLVDCLAVSLLGRRIMRNLLDSGGHQIRLFLDGYDEVSQTDCPDAHRLLDNLVKDGDNIRIFVATRPHKKTELEEKFGELGYNILPFDHSNKLAFFLRYWQRKHGVEITDGIMEFAKHCLKTMASKISSADNDIAGIPLQCRMLADIFAEDAKKGVLIQTDSQFQLNSIFQVYKHFIDKKFSTFCTDEERQTYYDFHAREALRTLFPETCKNWREKTPLPDAELIYRIGILEPLKSDSNKPAFSHRTLAEYFASEFLATSATSTLPMNGTESEFFIELFFRQALTWISPTSQRLLGYDIFLNPVVCRFLNFFLSTAHSDRHEFGPVKTALRESDIYNSKTLFKLLESCLLIDAVHLYLFLLKVFLEEFRDNPTSFLRFNQELPDTENWKEILKNELVNCLKREKRFPYLVVTAVKYSSLNLVKLSCDLLESVTGKKAHQFQYKHNASAMYWALERGHYQIFEYLLSFDKEQYYKKPLLRWCMEYSYGKQNADDRLQIVKRILDERPELLNKPSPDYHNEVPLLAHKVHFSLIKILIEAGADLTQTNKLKRNIAHLTADYFSAEEYHELVQIIISRNAQFLFQPRNEEGLTPLHWALKRIDLKSETLELMANKCNVIFNNSSWFGSELAVAIENGRSSRVIEDIVRLGGDKEKLDMRARKKLAREYNLQNKRQCIIN